VATLHDPADDRTYTLPGPKHLLGRGPECDIRLNDPMVSGRHAVILRAGNAFTIEDLGSRNGTRVNGESIRGAIPLHPGDRIDAGGHLLMFQVSAPPPPPPDAGAPIGVLRSLDLAAAMKTEVSPAAKLRAVLELSKNLGSVLKLDELLPKILDSLIALFPQSDRVFVLLPDHKTGRLEPKAVRTRRTTDESVVSRTVVDHAVKTGQALLVVDAGQDDRFNASQSIRMHRLRSIMCVPLLGRTGEPLGAIELDTREEGRAFSQEDLDVLAVAGLQAARALELVKLHHDLRELEAATQIQRGFLPAERPHAAGLSFFDHYASAGQVGGDYYDYVPLPGDRLAVAVGDVAGKGVTAALLMARLSATARFCLATEPSLPAAVRAISAGVTRACGPDRFITMVVGVIDLRAGTMTVVNAGHLPPLRRRPDGTVDEIGAEEAGIPLGVRDRPYDEVVVPVGPGELFAFVTDGVTEARNPAGDLYGPDRLRNQLARAPADAEKAGQAVLADVTRFAAGRPPSDDLTLVAFSRDE
jgi:serine phosphatase RsbU (regulator of sigma subunit)